MDGWMNIITRNEQYGLYTLLIQIYLMRVFSLGKRRGGGGISIVSKFFELLDFFVYSKRKCSVYGNVIKESETCLHFWTLNF